MRDVSGAAERHGSGPGAFGPEAGLHDAVATLSPIAAGSQSYPFPWLLLVRPLMHV